MTTYQVTWTIDIEAEDTQGAVEQAFELMQRPGTSATVFDVMPKEGGNVQTIDLTTEDTGTPRSETYNALFELVDEATCTGAFEDALNGEDEAMLDAVNAACRLLGRDEWAEGDDMPW